MLERPPDRPTPMRLLNIRTNDINAEGVTALKLVVRDRVVAGRGQFLLFADNYDHELFCSTLMRLARASVAALSGSQDAAHASDGQEGLPGPSISSAAERMQRIARRISQGQITNLNSAAPDSEMTAREQ